MTWRHGRTGIVSGDGWAGHFWEAPHRPLFLAAFVWALVAVAWWPLADMVGLRAPALGSQALWHAHELLFGFAGAAVGGYLLTALAGWVSQPPIRGISLKILLFLWVLARLAAMVAPFLPLSGLVVIQSGYFLWLAWLLGRAIIAGGALRKLGFCVVVLGLGIGDALLVVFAMTGRPEASATVVNMIVLIYALLIAVVGGAAVPAFSRNWLRQVGGKDADIRAASGARMAALACLGAALVLTFVGADTAGGVALILAALLLLWQMRGWRSRACLANPLLAALHLGYLWVPVGLGGLGLLLLWPVAYPQTGILHALTIGAMAGMIMAISGRAAALRENGTMRAAKGFLTGFLLVWFATWFRLIAPIWPGPGSLSILLAAGFWCVGWAVFIAGFLPSLRGPPVRPVLSGRKNVPTEVETNESFG